MFSAAELFDLSQTEHAELFEEDEEETSEELPSEGQPQKDPLLKKGD